jgi:hypothetical protein
LQGFGSLITQAKQGLVAFEVGIDIWDFVYRLDRISRQTADYLAIRQKLTGCDITLVSASEPTGDTPTEKFVETMLAGFAQMDNDVRGERAKNGLRARFLSGLHNGSVPLGYRRQTGYAATDPECFEAIKDAWELMATGTTSLRKLAELLNEKGIRDKRKGYKESLIRPQTLSGIFRNKFYAGKIVSKTHGLEVQGQHAPMITEELFYKVLSTAACGLRQITPVALWTAKIFPCAELLGAQYARDPLRAHGVKVTRACMGTTTASLAATWANQCP